MIFYLFLKFLTRIGLAIFFRKKIIHYRHTMSNKGPMILAVNHPNTLMDVLIVAVHTKQRVGFLANASLFDNPLMGRLLAYLHAIPVYRRQDLKAGEKMDNSDSFRKCVEYLENGGTLMVFPEGSSYSEMKLRKLKTGLSRIAFAFAEKNNFQKNLSIIPVGLNYSDPLYFRSDVMVNFGSPISIKEYHKTYQENQAKGIHAINDKLKHKFEEQLVLLKDKPQEKLFKNLLHTFVSPYKKPDFSYQYKLAKQLRHLDGAASEVYGQISSLNETYQKEQESLKLVYTESPKLTMTFILEILLLVLTFPIFLFGFIVHIFPAMLCQKLPSKTTKEFEYWAALKLLYGIFLYPIWYACIIIGVQIGLSLDKGEILMLLAALSICGLFTIFYIEVFQRILNTLRLYYISNRKSESFALLKDLKTKLIQLGSFTS